MTPLQTRFVVSLSQEGASRETPQQVQKCEFFYTSCGAATGTGHLASFRSIESTLLFPAGLPDRSTHTTLWALHFPTLCSVFPVSSRLLYESEISHETQRDRRVVRILCFVEQARCD